MTTNLRSADLADVPLEASSRAELPSRKLSVEEFARWSGLSVSPANKMRINGTGPRYLEFGRRVLYDLREAEVWAAQLARSHTSE